MSQERIAPAADGLPTPQRYIAVAAALAAIVLAVLDGAIANVALPTIAHDLGVAPAASVWIVTGYQIAVVVALLPFAALGESIGYARVFTGGVLVFTAASALCAVSPVLLLLVAARVAQGFGGAAIMGVLAALLRHTYPIGMLGTGLGLNAVVVGLASAAGPTLGAAILSVAAWPWLFAVNIPIGVLVLIAARALPRPDPSHSRLDRLSILLNAGFFAPLILGVDMLTSRPVAGLAAFCMSALCLTLLVRRESKRPAPLLPLDLLRSGTFRVSVIASVCIFAAQMLAFIALPFYLQHGLGRTVAETGLSMTPWPLTVAMAAPVAGRLADRVSSGVLCAVGGITMAAGLALAAAWPFAHDLAPLIGFTVVSGLGFGFFQTPNNRNMLLSAPKARSGAAGGMQATARLFGQTVGSVLAAVFLGLLPGIGPRAALGAAAVLALVAGLTSVLRIERLAAA